MDGSKRLQVRSQILLFKLLRYLADKEFDGVWLLVEAGRLHRSTGIVLNYGYWELLHDRTDTHSDGKVGGMWRETGRRGERVALRHALYDEKRHNTTH